ncbi:MAG TPA: hypothetical protein VFI00_03335 [Kribbella sp.]|nr:hypothetical protein [Kribbella sp.]
MTRPLTNAEENPHAGRGSSVLLDIGDGVGAIVITAPADLQDAEIERRPAGGPAEPPHAHDHDEPTHGHGHGGRRFPHVAVVPRPSPDGHTIHSAVFFDVPEGRYDLAVLPAGHVQLTVDVLGGQVTEAPWPHL